MKGMSKGKLPQLPGLTPEPGNWPATLPCHASRRKRRSVQEPEVRWQFA